MACFKVWPGSPETRAVTFCLKDSHGKEFAGHPMAQHSPFTSECACVIPKDVVPWYTCLLFSCPALRQHRPSHTELESPGLGMNTERKSSFAQRYLLLKHF